MGEYSYMPIRGPLSGSSFEAQTTAFFEKLAARTQAALDELGQAAQKLRLDVDNLSGRIDENTANIASLKAGIDSLGLHTGQLEDELAGLSKYAVATRQLLADLQVDVSALQAGQSENGAAISDLKARLAALEEANPPDGFIGLLAGGDLSGAWRECDGENGTPNLSGFAKSPIRYIQKRLAGS